MGWFAEREYQKTKTAEGEKDSLLHAVYDAWKQLEFDRQAHRDDARGGVAQEILKGQLEKYEYEPYLSRMR